MRCSQTALDLIWREEAGSPAYYAHHECDWPRGASGVTIGGFYDLGYVSQDEFRADWGDKLPASAMAELCHVIGIKGPPARSHAGELHGVIHIPWDVAQDVFLHREIPKWEAVVNKLPNADKLSGDSFGALVSLAMNRGDGFDSVRGHDPKDRYREMRLIKQDLAAERFDAIPPLIRSMQRLWPAHGDLWNRREDEADLFKRGLQPAIAAKQE